MQKTTATSPKVIISSKGAQIPLLLDSGSKVSLIHHTYFKEHLLPRIETRMGEKVDAHVLFKLIVANDGQLPKKMHTKLDVNFLALKVLNLGFCILEEPNSVLDRKHHTKLSGTIGWNLIWLAWKNMGEKFLTL